MLLLPDYVIQNVCVTCNYCARGGFDWLKVKFSEEKLLSVVNKRLIKNVFVVYLLFDIDKKINQVTVHLLPSSKQRRKHQRIAK